MQETFFQHPASLAQKRLWLLQQLEPQSANYHIPTLLELNGPVDRAALQQSVDWLAARHESFRTDFAFEQDVLWQRCHQHCALPVDWVDVSDCDDAQQQQRVAAERDKNIDLHQGPLARFTLFDCGEQRYLLLMVLHHIISDGWSAGIISRELAEGYNAARRGETLTRPELDIQYIDYTAWQQEEMAQESYRQSLRWWTERLRGIEPIAFPTDHARPARISTRGKTLGFRLPGELSRKLAQLARQRNNTLYSTLLSAFYLLLHRYSGQTDLAVGTPVAGRGQLALENVVGFFVNTLVYRIDLDREQRFDQLQQQVFETVLAGLEHQQVSFDRLVEAINPPRDLSYSPLFQIMFSFDEYEQSQWRFDGIDSQPRVTLGEHAKYDLTLSMEKQGDELLGAFEYSTDLFDDDTIARLSRNFMFLLSEIVAQPEAPLRAYQCVTPEEKALLLNDWQRERASHPVTATLHQQFEQQAARRPQAVALSGENGLRVSYRQLNRRANQLAHYLLKMKAQPGEHPSRVGLCLERDDNTLVAILAILKAGMTYVPIDSSHAQARIHYYVQDAGLNWVIGGEPFRHLFAGSDADFISLDNEAGLIATMPETNPEVAVTPDDLAYIIYTSGSTGNPKGVEIPHANVLRLFSASERHFQFGETDVWTLFHSCAFDFSVWEIWGALLYGARLSVVPYWVTRTPARFRQWLDDERVTVLNQTPSALYQLIAADSQAPGRCDSLRYIVLGGEALEPASLRAWFDKYGDDQPEIINMYGITETTVHVTWRKITQADAQQGGKSPIGVALDDLRIYLLDAQRNLVPLGAIGEMYVGGAGVARGYLHRPELTAERFIPLRDIFPPDPSSQDPLPQNQRGERVYRSGDLARFHADGSLEYLGRSDHQVKIRGFRIELGEIETTLKRLPQVEQAIVLAQRDEQQQTRLAAYVVSGESCTTEMLRAGLKETLPDYMLPSVFHFLEALPLTTNGKIDRAALLALQQDRPQLASEFVAARTEVERRLVDLWRQALQLDAIGVHDNFFALGGDSLRGVQLVGRANDLDWNLSLVDLFQHQTIAELATLIEQTLSGQRGGVARTEPFSLISAQDRAWLPDEVVDAYPLSRMQAGMFYHMQLTPDANVYHCTGTSHLRLSRPFDQSAFRQSVQEAVARHDVLRTAFDLENYSQPLQLVLRHAELPIVFEDLRHLSADEQEARIKALLESERVTPFDLLNPTLLRFFIYLRDDTSFQFTLTECHPVYDGWSYHSLIVEIFNRYAALTGVKDWLPDAKTGIEYRDFIAQEQRLINDPLQQQWWQEKLADCTLLKLPRKAGAQGYADIPPRLRSISLTLDAEVYKGIRRLMANLAVPMKSVLLSAHLKVMSLFSGENDVLTGIPTNGRPEAKGGDQLYGLFLNILPFRQQLTENSWGELIRQTFANESGMMPYRSFPLADIQRQFGPQPLLDEVLFNYMDFHVYERLLPELGFEVASNLNSDAVHEGTHFALNVHFQHYTLTSSLVSNQVSIQLDYNENLLSHEQVRHMADCYRAVFRAMVSDEQAIHTRQSFLTDAQRAQVAAFSHGKPGYQGTDTLAALFAEQVARQPDATAVILDERRLSYRQLDGHTTQLAHWLARQGVKKGDRVGLWLGRSIELVAAILALTKLEAVYVPLNKEDPVARRHEQLQDANCVLMLARQGDEAQVRQTPVPVLYLGEQGPWLSMPHTALPVSADNALPAYVMYTSGSTGKAKGVLIGQRGILRLVREVDYVELEPYQRFLMLAAVSFDASTLEMWGPLLNGGAIVIYPHDGVDIPRLSQLIQQHEVECLFLTTSLFNLLVDEQPQALQGVRQLLSGGEAMSASHAARIQALYPQLELVNGYGPTENTTFTTCYRYRADAVNDAQGIPIGRPNPGNEVLILDRFMQPVPVGTPGELYIGGDGLALDYLNQRELYDRLFVAHPQQPGRRLYKTGDRGRWLEDGNIEYLGRLDNQNKIRGYRIELGEIESVLCQHPGIERAAAVVVSDGPKKQIVACVVRLADSQPDSHALRTFLLERLPRYMVPGRFSFVDSLPLTMNGKLDVASLKQSLQAPVTLKPQSDPLVGTIQAVWAEVLSIPLPDQQENFFDLGGDSLLLARVHLKLVASGFPQLSVLDLLNFTTIEQLVQHIRGDKAAQTRDRQQVESSIQEGRRRLSALQAKRSMG
ncbi:non-ribosomal peptide synthetase [Dickeya sp. NCPPB 3274]|uniref:non-ribosomal peptide synthetase n=1 Tax=Dickeya sp. NCPPB 3274 TaxID=568766 RepID=UPI00039C92C5|nr:non-ribosomal peptide synthetase [Dickeya sp. NCPPB 3274]